MKGRGGRGRGCGGRGGRGGTGGRGGRRWAGRPFFRGAIGLLLILLLGVGCGGSGEEGSPEAGDASTRAGEAGPPPAPGMVGAGGEALVGGAGEAVYGYAFPDQGLRVEEGLRRAGEVLRSRPASEPIPERFGLGRPAQEAEIRELAIAVMPDGRGLPPGSGTAREGAPLYQAQCAACHGPEGEGGVDMALVGRNPGDAFDFGDGAGGVRTVGSYWPYATTVFDYIRRSMPWDRPGSLTDEEVYALTAWILYRNEIIGEEELMHAESLPQVIMPARDRFVPVDGVGLGGVR